MDKKARKTRTRRMSIKAKILLSTSIMVIFASLIMGYNSYTRINESMVELGIQEADMAASMTLSSLNPEVIAGLHENSQDTDGYKDVQDQLRKMQSTCKIAFLYTLYTDGNNVYYGVDSDEDAAIPGELFSESYEELKPVFAGKEYIQGYIDSTEDGDLITVYKPVIDSTGKVVGVLGCDYDASEIMAKLDKSVQRTFEICFLCLAISLLVINIVVGKITRGLNSVNTKIYDIVNNEGDLTQKLDVRTGDELELIAGNVNALIEYMRNIMTDISESAVQLTKSSEKMVGSMETADSGVVDVSAAMQQMSAAMEETTASINQINNSIQQIYDNVGYIAQNADNGEKFSDDMKTRALRAKDGAVESQNNARSETKKISEALNEKIEQSRAVEEISVLTDNIISITKQTNLLALNASIEAARAGDAGRGFSVVADEISKLASDSAQAAEQIRTVSANVISAVDALAGQAQEMIHFASQVADEGYQSLVDMGENYSNDAADMNKAMTAFADMSNKLSIAIDKIKEAVSNVNTAVEESAKGITSVTETAVELTENISDIKKETDSNGEIAKQLADEVGKFKV